jgi:hypothetical protein
MSRCGLDRDSRSRHQKRVSLDGQDSLDGRDNLDSFKKLVSTIEISRSRLRYLDLVSMSIAKSILIGRDQDFLRLIETSVILAYFCVLLDYFSISIEK